MESSPPPFTLIPQATYVHQLRADLPPELFKPATSRLLFVPALVAIIAVLVLAVARHWVPWPLVPVISLLLGFAFSGLTFLGHEGVHGGIVRGRRARQILGWVCFLPFWMSPRMWNAWHGRVHHSEANRDDDPDTYPTLEQYRASKKLQFLVDSFSLGGRRLRGLLSLVFGFTGQSSIVLFAAGSRGYLSKRDHALAFVESGLAIAVWVTVAILVGPLAFLFVFVAPLLVANVIVMTYILTNHSLSPRVEINDPVVSGLSVTAPRWYEWVTLNFGFHVEHHIFPAMSSRHARRVRDAIVKHWPGRYQSMSLASAVLALHRTARVYKDAVTLIDPTTGKEFPTLVPTDGLVAPRVEDSGEIEREDLGFVVGDPVGNPL